MLLSKYNLMYLHPPKTAGNTIQSILLPFSDDRKVLKGHRDGYDRFEIQGVITSKKHMTLAEYAERLGSRIHDYRIAMSVRHPVERAVSMYFSPHRWFRKAANGGFVLSEPVWDREQFDQMLSTMPCLSDFTTVDGIFYKPDFIVRQENLEEDFRFMSESAGLPQETRMTALELRNKSAGHAPFIRDLLRERALKKQIRDHFAVDFENFDFR
ncbi:MAG: sulfotransferase family 2 domain-containing protein [Pseudomonadota bacterium]